MALDILKDCKKYVIQKINNPGSYAVVEFKNEKTYERKRSQFQDLSANDVEKCTGASEIWIGRMIAVKNGKGFHRGRVDDIFYRNSVTKYWISLLDSGKYIEASERRIYLIKNQELKNEVTDVLELSIHNIQPAVLDINCESPISSGIFHLRKCKNWSIGAFEFVKKLFLYNPYVFVKIIKYDKKIFGEIYFTEDSDWKPISLSQKLCDEGFAVFCESTVNFNSNHSKSVMCRSIEGKIPANALVNDCDTYKTVNNIPVKSATKRRSLSKKSDDEDVTTQGISSIASHLENTSSSLYTDDSIIEYNNSSCLSTTSLDLKTNSQENFSISSKTPSSIGRPSPNSSKSVNIENEANENKLNVVGIVLRNLKLFNQQKHITGLHSQY